MNYIGSKLSLLAEIQAMLARRGALGGSFCDLFSGTGVVAQMARMQGFSVTANDLQTYSLVMQKCFLEAEGYPGFAGLLREIPAIALENADLARPTFGLGPAPGPESAPLRRVLAHLEKRREKGAFFDAYCEGGAAGRVYFSAEAGAGCEGIRSQIAAWGRAGLISEVETHVLLASLIETMDHLANTASVYGAYLKALKKTARQPLRLRLPRLLSQPGPHRARQLDAAALVRELAEGGVQDVLYLDPPYNQRQYHANYHLLETIARWDLGAFEPRGKTGLRPVEGQRSRFCSRREVAAAFEELLGAARFRHVLVSYSSEGLLPESELRALLERRACGPTEFHKIPYRRFRADQDGAARRYKSDVVEEFLFYARIG